MLNKVDLKKGLSTEEVAKQKELGLQNNYEENVAKSTKDIIFDNVMTLFNFKLCNRCLFTICRSVFQSGFLSDYYCEHVNRDFPRNSCP